MNSALLFVILLIIGQFAVWFVTITCKWTRSLRSFSIWSSAMFWSWLLSLSIYLAIFLRLTLPEVHFYCIVASCVTLVFVVIYHMIVLVECWRCTELATIHRLAAVSEVTERIRAMCSTSKATVKMSAKCWHWVFVKHLQSRKVSKIIEESLPFEVQIVHCGSNELDVARTAITEIVIEREMTVTDMYTRRLLSLCLSRFKAQHIEQDAVIDCRLICDIDGSDDQLFCRPVDRRSIWISRAGFWIAAAIGLTWPYRWSLSRATSTLVHHVSIAITVPPTPESNELLAQAAERDEGECSNYLNAAALLKDFLSRPSSPEDSKSEMFQDLRAGDASCLPPVIPPLPKSLSDEQPLMFDEP